MPTRFACLLLVAGCGAVPQPASTVPTGAQLDGTAIEQYWIIQDALSRGEAVPESDWKALFRTPAYRWQASDESTQRRIRHRMELAFQPDREPLDSALDEAEGYDVVRWGHHARIRDERMILGETFDALTRFEWIEDALEMARLYVPDGDLASVEVWTPVRLLFFAPDALLDDGVIYLDLVHAQDRGTGLVRLLAHEFHHVLYERAYPFSNVDEDAELYWVLATLKKLQMEGLADRIDKIRAPLAAIPGLSTGYVEKFNEHYRAAPATLTRLGAALVEVVETEDRSNASRAVWDLLHLGGHPEGFFVANTIATELGNAALLADIGQPFAFLRRFQSASGLLSEDAMTALATIEAELNRMP